MVHSSSPPPRRLRRPPPLSSSSGERFKGVRRRSWGRWVSEIRIPHSRDKIWLGSYSTAEQAARAYDVASLLLRGSSCSSYLNFADSTALMTTDRRLAALVAAGIASPRTIQATASAAANSVMVPMDTRAACSNVDISSRDMDDDNCPQISSDTSSKEHELAAESRCDSESMVETRRAAAHATTSNAMPEAGWIQDVLTLIISPKDRSGSPPSFNYCLQLSPSIARCSAPSPSSNIPAAIPSSCHGFTQSSSKATSPDYLLHMLFDGFQCPLEGLTMDGFTAISPAVTTSKRFDMETVGTSCGVNSTQLWS